ncbi:hypothetical protein RN001_000421 [Aquatica leii]|uniref:Uncharacterized protein n=1 Tax=Aquatica leii TaxID=1421715 RepID=A0AAN7Q9M4_9COLE|nr:hypothetical protein RN001_000421 [Aquatica leii]
MNIWSLKQLEGMNPVLLYKYGHPLTLEGLQGSATYVEVPAKLLENTALVKEAYCASQNLLEIEPQMSERTNVSLPNTSQSAHENTNTHSGNLYEHYISDNTDTIKSQLQITELRSLLSKWNVKAIVDELIAQKVFVDILKIIKRHHIQFLLKKIDLATWIAFEHHLEQWRDCIGMLLSPWSCSNHSSPTSSVGSISRPQTPERENQFSSYKRFTQSPSLNDNKPSTSIQLSTILELSTRGSMLVETYNKFGKFDEEQRNSLITLIAKFFEDKSLKMSLATSYKIEREILKRFPSEKLEYYRTSKRGRLYAKYCNITASFKKGVLKQVAEGTKKKTERTKSRHEEVLGKHKNNHQHLVDSSASARDHAK